MKTDVAKVEQTDLAPVNALMEMAMSKDVDVEKLERLIALQERGMERDAKMSFIRAMTEFHSQVGPMKKTRGVWFDERAGAKAAYYYAELSEIEKVVRPLLAELGMFYSWDGVYADGVYTSICRLQHADGHSVTGSFAAPVEKQAKMNKVQSTSSTETYCRRKSLIAVCGLSTAEDDNDGRGGDDGEEETISTGQLADLVSLMQEVFDADEFVERKGRFINHIGCELSEIAVDKYADLVRELEGARS